MSSGGAGQAGYVGRPIPRGRQPVLDRLAGASRRFQVHALIELDVSRAAERIRTSSEDVSWTAFVIASVARGVALHPALNARRAGGRVPSRLPSVPQPSTHPGPDQPSGPDSGMSDNPRSRKAAIVASFGERPLAFRPRSFFSFADQTSANRSPPTSRRW